MLPWHHDRAPDRARREHASGAALVRAGLEASSARGAERVFFVIELQPGAVADVRGRVRYHPVFDGL